MRRLSRFALKIGACLLCFVGAALAQTNPNLERGLKPYGAFAGGNIDSVSLTNGNLTLHAPLVSYPQRGGKLTLSFFLRYNNKGWSALCSFYPGAGWRCPWTWQGTGVETVRDQTIGLRDDGGDFPVIPDPFGGTRWVPILSAVTADGGTHQLGEIQPPWPLRYESLDASGIRFESFYDGGGVIRSYMVDGSGIRHTAETLDNGRTYYPIVSEDPNGNKITVTSTGWVDTLGRTIPGSVPIGWDYGAINQYEKLLPGVPTTDFSSCPFGTLSARIWNLPGPKGGTSPIKMCYASYALQSNFQVQHLLPPGYYYPQGSATARMLRAIILPNQTPWLFAYDSWGDLSSITLPTGGTITYTWTTFEGCATGDTIVSRAVASRTINANDGTGPQTWTYSYRVNIGGQYSTVVTDPAGNQSVHAVSGGGCRYETRMQQYEGSYTTGTLLKTVETEYPAPYGNPFDYYTGQGTIINVVPTSIKTTWPNGKVSEIQKVYDSGGTFTIYNAAFDRYDTHPLVYGSVIEETAYEYGQDAPGPVLRKTVHEYLWRIDDNYKSRNMLDLVAWSRVQNNTAAHTSCTSPAPAACTTYGYDQTTPVDSGITTQHVVPPWVGSYRGNQTSVSRWRNTTGTFLTSTSTYFDTGMVKEAKDPLLHATTFAYSTAFAGAYPTEVTNAAGHITTNNYDFNTGLLTSTTDPNNRTTSYTYDNMFRLIQTDFPDTEQTTFAYTAVAPFKVTVTSKVTSSMNMVAEGEVDGLGRTRKTKLASDPQGAVYSLAEYDGVGRKWKEWNPTRCDFSSPPYSCPNEASFGVTEYQYDALGRVTKVIPPDGTATSNNITTEYAANTTTVTDQVGKKRKSETDALGRLTRVWEPDAAGSFVYETAYQYDVLDNLARADQKGNHPTPANWRTRTFAYNSLSQLTSATNPETQFCATTYTYDDDGNMLTKVVPRANQTSCATTTTTTYDYDALHRLARKSYNDGTPLAKYLYDGELPVAGAGCSSSISMTVSNGIGRRTGMCDAGVEAWSYDPMGRVLTNRRTTNDVTKDVTYSYNLDGSLFQLAYPSGRKVEYTPTGAGRPLDARDVTVPTNPIKYAVGASYAPHGALGSVVLAETATFTGINLNHGYNNRLQPTTIRAWSTNGTALDLTYCFNKNIVPTNNCDATPIVNNGNVAQIKNNLNTARTQNFTYDELNRIKTAATQGTTGPHAWGLSFGYDVWANLLSAAVTQGDPTALSLSVTSSNRISGFCYDAAGNLLAETASPCPPPAPTYTYDAENRMITAPGVTYTYDGDGKRVKKSNGKLYWYGAGSEVLLESNLSGVESDEYILFGGKRIARRDALGNVFYYFADHLGSSRVVTNTTGTILDDADFYPFGGERAVTSTSGNTYKFTGKERDPETGLDFFIVRYYSSGYGRFFSPDEFTGGPVDAFSANDPLPPGPLPYANITNPQSLNKYTYTYNNPLNYIDPDGHDALNVAVSFAVQVLKDTVVGGAKGLANRVIETANLINKPLDAALSNVTEFRFGQVERFEPATPGERSAMLGTDISVAFVPGAGASRTVQLSQSVSVAVREEKVAKNLEIVAKYTDAALERSARKAEKSVARHLEEMKRVAVSAHKSIKKDIRHALERLEAIRREQLARR